ncbi:D-amino-acid transaminase [Alphaproteobacteria bacterium]|nr:D-amino-acid transaminase [Alphaproteobacteria bacterium]MDA8623987.1 D-amino-acid transaminase [Alphaproteobacteria bacterium]MDA8625729.1 D-amino-acid transaminase [Alphaproteobacteria bacterium]MDA8666974.1 D-amino-acid transaminase [Alphaproteobacteria bacterium]MDA8779795.1 D-amino-acid transaminase [Alphaproteobacteria bacterium]
MSRIAYIDGVYQPLNMPGILVEDRGYQFADGVYEVCAIRGGKLLDEARHLDRLDYSLAALDMPPPMSRLALQQVMRETLRRNRVRDGILYMQVSRGVAPREHMFNPDLKPVLVITARPIAADRRAQIMKKGISVVSVPDQRWARCDIKSISLLPNVLARQSARNAKVQEAWQIDGQGMVTEGAATNAWIVDAKGVLRTRPASHEILNGIVRQVLLDCVADLGMKFEEKPFSLKEALAARECFSTASTMSVFPVIEIDGQKIGAGKPGEVAKMLSDAYDAVEV